MVLYKPDCDSNDCELLNEKATPSILAIGEVVLSPDPTLEEGKGPDEFGHNPWVRERNLSAPMRLQL